jgi:hypothetical protein
MATIHTNAFGQDLVIAFDYRVTYRGHPGRGASFNSPGEPPEPMEFSATITSVRRDIPRPAFETWADHAYAAEREQEWKREIAPIDVGALKPIIEEWLATDCDDAREEVERGEVGAYYDRADYGYEKRRDDRMEA